MVLPGDAFAVGYAPSAQTEALWRLDASAQKLFQSFQSNLLSLISHELRTPLMGVLNSLELLRGGEEASPIPPAELIQMAHRNATRLQSTLASLLDLASFESGSFRADLREVRLGRVVKSRIDARAQQAAELGVSIDFTQPEGSADAVFLADPQKVGRAVELVLQALMERVDSGSTLSMRLSLDRIVMSVRLSAPRIEHWDSAWTHSRVGIQAGIASPLAAFAGTLQSTEGFLTRSEEGLGSELLLVHEIMKMHGGHLEAQRSGADLSLGLVFPSLSPGDSVRLALRSRLARLDPSAGSMGSLALAVLVATGPPQPNSDLLSQVRQSLPRSSDSAWQLEDGKIAAFLEDCRNPEALRWAESFGTKIRFGIVDIPEDGIDAEGLLLLALERAGKA